MFRAASFASSTKAVCISVVVIIVIGGGRCGAARWPRSPPVAAGFWVRPGRCHLVRALVYHLSDHRRSLFALIGGRAARELWPAHDDWERILGVDLAEPMLDLAADMLKGIRLSIILNLFM